MLLPLAPREEPGDEDVFESQDLLIQQGVEIMPFSYFDELSEEARSNILSWHIKMILALK